MSYVIGLISGTSADGIDAALVEIQGTQHDLQVDLIQAETVPYPPDLHRKVVAVGQGELLTMEAFADLDDAIAVAFAEAARGLRVPGLDVRLIGSHGQTVFHRPAVNQQLGYSLQLGRGSLIAKMTGIPTVSNFRAADIAAGGQGAPLVSPVDACLLSHPHENRCVQNLGGIGNVTYLPSHQHSDWQKQISGWDTGPSNSLLDLAVQQLTYGRKLYDQDGRWAAQGTPALTLVNQWLQQDFFQLSPPKSTGRELFGEDYLKQCWLDAQDHHLSPADWLATLVELSVASIVHSYQTFLPQMPDRVLLCGGGCRNQYFVQQLIEALSPIPVETTGQWGLDPNYKEAIAFAVLAYWYQKGCPGNLPQVTGAREAVVLGEYHPLY